MRILITGGSGQLGTSLQRQLAGTDYLAPSHAQLDITDAEQVYEFFQATRPDAVIHCAAYNNVDLAETESEQCRLVNVKGTENIVSAARVFGSYVIYTSSDYVFDGRKVGAYQTADKKNPLSVYGASKSKAEDLVLAEPNNAVVRISWLFGPGERNFVRAVLRAARARPSLSVVNDQIGSPTYTEDLAALLCEMLGKRPQGIFHATNEGVCGKSFRSIRDQNRNHWSNQRAVSLQRTAPFELQAEQNKSGRCGAASAPWVGRCIDTLFSG